jgi:hypothetical protein
MNVASFIAANHSDPQHSRTDETTRIIIVIVMRKKICKHALVSSETSSNDGERYEGRAPVSTDVISSLFPPASASQYVS